MNVSGKLFVQNIAGLDVMYDIDDNAFIGFSTVVERERSKSKIVAIYPISENDWMDMRQLPELERIGIRLFGE